MDEDPHIRTHIYFGNVEIIYRLAGALSPWIGLNLNHLLREANEIDEKGQKINK